MGKKRVSRNGKVKARDPCHVTLLLDDRWCIKTFNEWAGIITGLDADRVIGIDWKEALRNTPLEELLDFQEVLAHGHSVLNLPIYLPGLPEPRDKIVLVTAVPCMGPKGLIEWSFVSINCDHDLSPFSAIFDSLAEGIMTVDRQWRVTGFNKSAEKITGFGREEVMGRPCTELFGEGLCGEALVMAIDEQRAVEDRKAFVTKKNGGMIPVIVSASPLVGPGDMPVGGVETFRLATMEMERDLILDSIADGVFTVDRHWRITSFNKAAEKITGVPAEKALGMTCREVFRVDICGPSCALAQSMRMGQSLANRRVTIRRHDGTNIPISISTAPLVDNVGNVIGGVETFRDLREMESLRKRLPGQFTFGDIISKNPQMQKIFDILPEISLSDSNVLILGESGTGKELVARAVHDFSRRKRGPFVAVNCGALPDTLLESELFGYKAGAFTDAKHDRPGRFAAAEKGTIFLDEIGDISPALQVKLLRVLQSKTYEPLGSNRPVTADVRILAATNRDLMELVQEGSFREDLYYRLNVVQIHLPPLRERPEDIPLLIEHFIGKFNAEKGKDISGISEQALSMLLKHDFPGNIRELENIIEYAFILCHGGLIETEHLPEPFSSVRNRSVVPMIGFDRPLTLDELEKEAITRALIRNNWKKMATCRELGISKDTLRRKVKRYKIRREDLP